MLTWWGVVDFRRATSRYFELIGSFYDPRKHTLNHDVMDYAREMLHAYSLARRLRSRPAKKARSKKSTNITRITK